MRPPLPLSRGSILLLVLISGAVVMTVTVAFFNQFASAIRAERFALAGVQARALAEAGIDHAVSALDEDEAYAGESDVPLGGGTFSVSVSGAVGAKRLTASGFVPDSVNPLAQKVIRVSVSTTSPGIHGPGSPWAAVPGTYVLSD